VELIKVWFLTIKEKLLRLQMVHASKCMQIMALSMSLDGVKAAAEQSHSGYRKRTALYYVCTMLLVVVLKSYL